MKKWFFAVSLVILAAGLISAAVANNPKDRFDYKQVRAVSQQWNMTVDLKQGQDYWLEIRQGSDWPTGMFDEASDMYPGYGALYVGVNITDPNGGTTLFLITYGQSVENDPKETLRPLVYLNITLERNAGGWDASRYVLNGTNYYRYTEVGGTPQYNGTYIITVGYIMPSRDDPPSQIWLGERITWVEYPYTHLLPAGIVTSGVGIGLMWFSVKKKARIRKESSTSINHRIHR